MGRDTPPLRAAAHRAAGLPDNVPPLWPEPTRSRRCHLQLGHVCFLLCLTLSQLEESSWLGQDMGADLAERAGVPSASAGEDSELPGGSGRAAQLFSQALQQLLGDLFPLSSFPFLLCQFSSLTIS